MRSRILWGKTVKRHGEKKTHKRERDRQRTETDIERQTERETEREREIDTQKERKRDREREREEQEGERKGDALSLIGYLQCCTDERCHATLAFPTLWILCMRRTRVILAGRKSPCWWVTEREREREREKERERSIYR